MYDWPIRRGMLYTGGIAVVSAWLSIQLPPWGLFALAAVLLLSLLIPHLRQSVWVYTAICAAVLLCIGGSYRLLQVTPVERQIGQTDTVTAIIEELPANGHMVTARIIAADRLPVGSRVLLYCPDRAMPSRYDTVRTQVELRALYEVQERYRADGVFLQAYPLAFDEDALDILPDTPSFQKRMEQLRRRLLEPLYARLPQQEGALLAGLCLGDTRGMETATATAFRRAGLPHLLVVSGLHLSVIAGGAYAAGRILLRRRRLAAIVAMIIAVFFALLVGLSPSVIRAGIACLVLLGGQLFYRRADGLNSLGLALTLLLVGNPYALLDAGLQLSFGATVGVLCLAAPIASLLRRWLGRWLAGGLSVTLAASLPIAPLLARLFGEVSLISPIANLLAVAPSSIALVLGCIAMPLALCPPLAWLADGLLFIAAWSARPVLWIAHALGDWPCATLTVEYAWVWFYLTGVCGLSILCIYKRRLLGRTVALLAVLAVVATGLHTFIAQNSTRVELSTRADNAVTLVEQNGRTGLIVQSAAGLLADARLTRVCGGQLDVLVIGSGDTTDTARLTELLKQIDVNRLYSGGDPRWLIGLGVDAIPLAPNTTVPLWENTTLSTAITGWQLHADGTPLALTPPQEGTIHLTARSGGEWRRTPWR